MAVIERLEGVKDYPVIGYIVIVPYTIGFSVKIFKYLTNAKKYAREVNKFLVGEDLGHWKVHIEYRTDMCGLKFSD